MHAYGWNPDRPDQRDYPYTARPAQPAPSAVNLRPYCPPIYDQGQEGSCTANAIAAAIGYERHRQGLPYFIPSRQFIYYNERLIEGTESSDSGAMIRDGFKTIASQGVCSEYRWPYSMGFATKPYPSCYLAAVPHRTLKYLSVTPGVDMLYCLAQGFPFVFGITVYDSFESPAADETGDVPLPGPDESVLGGHALLAVGYDLTTKRIAFRNSWGAAWGDEGYGTIPFSYLTDPNLADDFWTIRLEQ